MSARCEGCGRFARELWNEGGDDGSGGCPEFWCCAVCASPASKGSET